MKDYLPSPACAMDSHPLPLGEGSCAMVVLTPSPFGRGGAKTSALMGVRAA